MRRFVMLGVFLTLTALSFGRSVAIQEDGRTKASVLNRYQFQYRMMQQDELGTHMRFAQTYQGIEVWGGEIVRHFQKKTQVWVNGRVHDDIKCGTIPLLNNCQSVESVDGTLTFSTCTS
ncbi:MAG: hypothetical protein GXO70_09920 [Acidobacteria bacterium]|nr:hypothetical protein [Acidobacteriota bacterium]